MRLFYEWGTKQIHKAGEELCGDSIAISRHSQSVTLALSDGLGSGVKANILSTLATRIAMHLLENELPLNEVVQTLSQTLPVCQQRKLAYSTFAIAQFFTQGFAKVVEFDTPAAMFLRNRKIKPVAYEERSLEGKTVREALINLKNGDWIVFVSDGVLNAGIGGLYPLGWGWQQTAKFLEKHAHRDLSAEDLAGKVSDTVHELYAGAPGDDVSVVVIKVRRKLMATVFTGPPANPEKDKKVVDKFLKRAGKLAVCGGTTGKIVARHLGQPLEVDLNTMTKEVPPVAHMEGIDLVCEGILTLSKVSELLRKGVQKKAIRFKTDGASNLIRLLLEADHVDFLVGQALNPAHQNPELPGQLIIRKRVVREIADALIDMGKEVTIEFI